LQQQQQQQQQQRGGYEREQSALANEPNRRAEGRAWVVSPRHERFERIEPIGKKGAVPRMPGIAGDRTLVLAMPVKAPSTVCGERVGGVSEGPTRRIRSAEQSDG
jgi:hypothetical protein